MTICERSRRRSSRTRHSFVYCCFNSTSSKKANVGDDLHLEPTFHLFIVNHRKNLLCPLDFRYYLSSAGCLYLCMYLCIYVIAIVATLFNLELWNFGTTFLLWLSKNCFPKFLKHFWFIYRAIALFQCKFEEQLWENQRQKFTW